MEDDCSSVALLAVFFVSLFIFNKPDTTKEKSYDSSAPISSSNVPQNENSSNSSTRGGSKDYNRDASKGGTSNTPAIGELLSADDFKEEITNYLNEKYDLNLPENEEYETLAGLILYYNEDIPEEGERISIEDISFEIVSVKSARIEED